MSAEGLEDLLGGFADLLGGRDGGAASQIDFQGLLEGLRGGAAGVGAPSPEGGFRGRNRDAGATPSSSRGGGGFRGFGRERDGGPFVDAAVPGSGADGEAMEPPAIEPGAQDAGSDEGDVAPLTSVDSGL